MVRKSFRLFVSSTFKDFVAERRILQERVFPELQRHCASQDFGFRAVDMRWGVNEGAQIDQRTASLCLEEVLDASAFPRPNLLILCGDRYGWTPLPFAIAADEFETLSDWLGTQGSPDVAELNRVYQRDDNHKVAPGLTRSTDQFVSAFTLRPREGELANLGDAVVWGSVESRVRAALQAAADHLAREGLLDGRGRDKYFLSLTEQEVRAGLEDSRDVGRCNTGAIGWVKTTGSGEPGAQALADFVKARLPANDIVTSASVVDDYEAEFASILITKLRRAIDDHIAATQSLLQEPDNALQTERHYHADLAAKRTRGFVGRKADRDAIAGYLKGDSQRPLVLLGRSGSGKTALMARAAADAETRAGLRVVKRFVGASATSADQRSLLISVGNELAALGVAKTPERWEDDANLFIRQIRDLISNIDQPVVIFIDALDQIAPPYRPSWLPTLLNPKVKIAVSVLDDETFARDDQIVRGLKASLPADAFLRIEALSDAEGRDILLGLERDAGRALQVDQRELILEHFVRAGGSPLFLTIAFAISRRWRSSDRAHDQRLADDTASLIGQLLDELSIVHHHEPLLVQRMLGLLAAGKDGLSEGELIGVLSRDAEVMRAISSEQFGARALRLPDSVWVRLRRDLGALLVEKGARGEPLLNFFHRQVGEVVRARFYEPYQVELHRALASYFETRSPVNEGVDGLGTRALSELPYQLYHAGERTRLDALLTDAGWIDQKIEAFDGVTEVVADYDGYADPSQTLQKSIGRTLRLAAGIIARDPRQRIPQLHGRLLGLRTDTAHSAFLDELVERIPRGALFESYPALLPPGAEVARFEGHTQGVVALALCDEGRIVSASHDKTIRVWETSTSREIACFGGHREVVSALQPLSGNRVASGSWDGTVRIWNVATGRAELTWLIGGEMPSRSPDDEALSSIKTMTLLGDERLVFAEAGNLYLWELRDSSSSPRQISQPTIDQPRWIDVVAAVGDHELAVLWNKYIFVWSVAGRRPKRRIEAAGSVVAHTVFSDGRLVTATKEGVVQIWDCQEGREQVRLEGCGRQIRALASLPDGRLATGDAEGELRVWDLETRKGGARLKITGSSKINSMVALAGGEIAIGAEEGAIRILDIDGGVDRVSDPEPRIFALAALDDGSLVSGTEKGILVWDGASGGAIGGLMEAQELIDLPLPEEFKRGQRAVSALAALPDGRVASGSWLGSITYWDPRARRACGGSMGHERQLTAFVVLSGKRVASCSSDGTLRVWDTASSRELARLEGHTDRVTCLAALTDDTIASGADDRTIRIWDAARAAQIALFSGHTGPVNALAALPGQRLVSGSSDHTLRIWNVAAPEQSRIIHEGLDVRAVAALSSGMLATGSTDHTVRVWDVDTGAELARLELDASISALTEMPDGRLAVGDELGRIHWLAFNGGAPEFSGSQPQHHEILARSRLDSKSGAIGVADAEKAPNHSKVSSGEGPTGRGIELEIRPRPKGRLRMLVLAAFMLSASIALAFLLPSAWGSAVNDAWRALVASIAATND